MRADADLTARHDIREIAVGFQHVLHEVSARIANITLNRPERMNA